jgi:RNA polymerase sigma-70 factor (family 1)
MSLKPPLTAEEFLSFQEGDEHIFEYVYNVYFDMIVKKVYRLCKEVAVAEEITQESFVQLYLHKENLKDAEGIYPYLYVVSKRLAISHFRKKVNQEEYENYRASSWEESTDENQKRIENKDLSAVIQNAINELPQQQRIVYQMNKLEDKSYHEIADMVGLSKNTVRNHIATATKIIRLKLHNFLFLLLLIKILFSI